MRCHHKTASGSRCSRKCPGRGKKCWQHGSGQKGGAVPTSSKITCYSPKGEFICSSGQRNYSCGTNPQKNESIDNVYKCQKTGTIAFSCNRLGHQHSADKVCYSYYHVNESLLARLDNQCSKLNTKEELITRLCDLIDDVEYSDQESFDDEEIEDLISEARIPIPRSGSGRSLRAGNRES